MKLVAKGNSGADMPERVRDSYHAHSMTKYKLEVERRYTPFAMALFWPMGLKVLILDESGRPNWIPLALFGVVDGRVPASWRFDTPALVNAPSVTAIWGYGELLTNPSHFEQLIERKIQAWEAFIDAAGQRDDLESHERDALETNRARIRQYREDRA